MNLELKQYFLSILVKKDFSESELLQKALKKGYTNIAINEIIESLKEQNFVNDQRLAENIVSYYGGKKGKLWLSQKMQQRGLQKDLIKEVLDVEETVDPQLKDKLAQKFRVTDWSTLDFSIKQKILAFLYRQGFTKAQDILKEWTNPLDENY